MNLSVPLFRFSPSRLGRVRAGAERYSPARNFITITPILTFPHRGGRNLEILAAPLSHLVAIVILSLAVV